MNEFQLKTPQKETKLSWEEIAMKNYEINPQGHIKFPAAIQKQIDNTSKAELLRSKISQKIGLELQVIKENGNFRIEVKRTLTVPSPLYWQSSMAMSKIIEEKLSRMSIYILSPFLAFNINHMPVENEPLAGNSSEGKKINRRSIVEKQIASILELMNSTPNLLKNVNAIVLNFQHPNELEKADNISSVVIPLLYIWSLKNSASNDGKSTNTNYNEMAENIEKLISPSLNHYNRNYEALKRLKSGI